MDTNLLYEVVEKAKKYDELIKIGRNETVNCSFCGKRQEEVELLVRGEIALICDECIELCSEIVDDKMIKKALEDN